MYIWANMFLEWAATLPHRCHRDLHHLAAATRAKHLVWRPKNLALKHAKNDVGYFW